MNNRCPDSSELLSLTLGQLSERRHKALEAHLASCSHCQQEHAALVQLRSVVRAQTPQMPAGLSERTWRTLPTAQGKTRPRWRPVALGTGTAALAGVLGLTLLPGMLIRPTPAFAQVKQAMDQVNTATWNETVYCTEQDGEKEISRRECWAQINTAQISYREKGDAPNKEVMIVDGERMWAISLKRSQWRLLDGWRAKRQFFPGKSAADLVRQELLFPRDPAAWQERTSTSVPAPYTAQLERQSAWKMTRDGELLRFQMKIALPESPNQPTGTETVWVKPDTFRIVRRERVYQMSILNVKKPYVLISRKVCDNYRYDLTPPAGVFTVPVPEPGTPYIFSNMSQKQPPLASRDIQAVRQALTKAASAWNRKDPTAFLACWDWKNYSLAETSRTGLVQMDPAESIQQAQKQWRMLVIAGAPFPRWELERVGVAIANNGVYIRSAKNSPFPPLASPSNGLAMNGTARATDSQGRRWRIQLSAQLQRQPSGEFRLTSLTVSPRRQAPL